MVVKFNFPNKPVIEWKGESYIPRGRIISSQKYYKVIVKWCLYHILRVKHLESEVHPILVSFRSEGISGGLS